MLDYPASEMVPSGSSQPHAPDYPNDTPGTDLGFVRNKPLEVTTEAVPSRGGEQCPRALFEPLWIRDRSDAARTRREVARGRREPAVHRDVEGDAALYPNVSRTSTS
jgi:hypothetical protein